MRITRGTVIGLAATAVVLAAAVAAGSQVGELVAHREDERATPPPSQQPRQEPSPTPTPSASVRPTNVSTDHPLLNLNRDTQYTMLDIPASSGCPARTVRIDGNHNGTSDGVGFFFIDEPLTSYGDLTGDGRIRLSNAYLNQIEETDVREYKLNGSDLVRVS